MGMDLRTRGGRPTSPQSTVLPSSSKNGQSRNDERKVLVTRKIKRQQRQGPKTIFEYIVDNQLSKLTLPRH
jgi:hypothetical protein